jgi:putative sigma-54 modulation protein
MKIILSGKNMEITDSLRDKVNRKVKKLERYFGPEIEAQVTLSVEKNRHMVEVTIPFDGVILRAEEVTDDMYASIDMVLDKLEKQIHKHRTKLERKIRQGAFKYEKPLFSDEFTTIEKEPRVVRTKRFAIKPMAVEEALMQMDLVGHSFYVFTNADTDEVNVVYKRKDGNYGLIEPEYM